MKKLTPLLLVGTILISACSLLPAQPLVALALDSPAQPFQSGVQIAKPTYTPFPTVTVAPVFTATSTPAPVTDSPTPATISTPLPTDTPAVSAFSEDAFVVDGSETTSSSGYDSTTPNDPPSAYSGNKLILVDISEQHMYVYEGDALVYSFVVSTGIGNSTRVGTFSVLNKIPNAYGATWNIWMPNWLGIYWSGSLQNGIHALPILSNGATLWAGYLGRPVSYGCVVLGTEDAKTLYDWAEVGTPVEIRW